MACWNQAMLRIYVARYYLRVLCRISQYSNPEFAVAIYCGLKILATTLVYCFEAPVLLTGSQRETIGTCVPLLFHPPDETKLPVARVVVYDTILLLNISMDMPSS